MIHSEKQKKGEWIVRSTLKELVARKERELNRLIHNKEIAEATGISEHTIGRWMRPDAFGQIDPKVALALCDFLSCEFGDLLIRDVAEPS